MVIYKSLMSLRIVNDLQSYNTPKSLKFSQIMLMIYNKQQFISSFIVEAYNFWKIREG